MTSANYAPLCGREGTVFGYLVLDEDRPVRASSSKNGKRWYYGAWSSSTLPVSLFRDYKTAARVKHAIKSKHARQANSFNPGLGGDQKRCFDLWLDRMKSVRIVRVALDDAPLEAIA